MAPISRRVGGRGASSQHGVTFFGISLSKIASLRFVFDGCNPLHIKPDALRTRRRGVLFRVVGVLLRTRGVAHLSSVPGGITMATVRFHWQYHEQSAFRGAFRSAACVRGDDVLESGGWVPARDRTEELIVTLTSLKDGSVERLHTGNAPQDRAGTR